MAKCEHCGAGFTPAAKQRHHRARFCSTRCRVANHRATAAKTDCEECGRTVALSRARISPDIDGNRVVCAWCCNRLEKAAG